MRAHDEEFARFIPPDSVGIDVAKLPVFALAPWQGVALFPCDASYVDIWGMPVDVPAGFPQEH